MLDETVEKGVCVACKQSPGDHGAFLIVVSDMNGPKLAFQCSNHTSATDQIWDAGAIRTLLLQVNQRNKKLMKEELAKETVGPNNAV